VRALRQLVLSFSIIFPIAEFAFGADNRPNLLFLLADDQRADTIAAFGNPYIRTPNLDRLAHSGLAFSRAYMQGALNPATCMPSRAMLLSGRSLFRIDERLTRDETWPAAFGRAGYTTFMTGKWHNDEQSLYPRFLRGPWTNEVSSVSKSFQSARAVFIGGMIDPMNAKLSDLADAKLGTPYVKPQHSCETFANEAVRFLDEHRGSPFFCYVAFNAPHDPHTVPDDYSVRYDPQTLPLPANFLPQHPWDNGEMQIRDETLLSWPRPPDKVRALLAEYYRYVSYLDTQVGRILDALRASPFAGNTIVIFCADSGVARGSHGLIGKQSLYEHSVRVPLIISGPGIPVARQTDAMVYLLDVLPTMGKLCGVPAPKTSEGIAFSATLQNPAKPARTQLMFAYQNVQRAVRHGRWKLIRYPLVDKTQLFDLEADAQETTNLAYKSEHAAKVKELMALLAREQTRFGDSAPLKLENPKPAQWMPP
jgi:arylsulfatase A-like enzyme